METKKYKIIIKLCQKEVKMSNGINFSARFGYLYKKNEDGILVEVNRKDSKSNSIRFKYALNAKKYVSENKEKIKYPYFAELVEDDDFFFTFDKYLNGNKKKDKDGNDILVIVITNLDDSKILTNPKVDNSSYQNNKIALDEIF